MAKGERLVGVIGGMGPDATIDFMSRVLEKTPADKDQDHIRMLVEHNPRIPSRQLAMRGDGENPGPVLAEMAMRLEAAGADFIVMPCNAAHAWQDDIVAAVNIPFVSIIEASVSKALQLAPDNCAVGVLTTPACFAAGLYQEALADANREAILQTPDELDEAIALIDRIKGGDQSEPVVAGLRELAERLLSRGAKTLIAACTELPLVLNSTMFTVPLVSSTDVLAEKTVALALSDEPLQKQ
ncbi:MAG: amino acid racemase [Gammaproteobacteria bacterium]|nr:amino acid racemase [Gammaproteobacteria bacterium]